MKKARDSLKRVLLSSCAAFNGRLAAVAAWVAVRTFNHAHLVSSEPIQLIEPIQPDSLQPIPEPVRKETPMETAKVEPKRAVCPWPRERVEHMVRLMAQGSSVADTALQLGVTVDEMNFALKTLPDNLAGASRPGDWPGYKVAALLRGLAEHRNFAEIARDVGHTRGAVSCKARRLRRLGQLRGPKSPETGSGASLAAVSTPAAPKEPEETFAALPAPKRTEKRPPFGERSILDMAFNSCRWPTGQNSSGQHVFCGRRREDGYAFCAVHALRAHTFALGGDGERARVERKAQGADYT